MIEVKMPLIKISEWRDGVIFKTEFVQDVWVPIDKAKSGVFYKGSKELILGTPDEFITRRIAENEQR